MRVAINTNYDAAGTKVCVEDMMPRFQVAGHKVVRNDWDHYDQYDLALFMAPDAEVEKAKVQNPNIIAGIMNPTWTPQRERGTRMADFLLVGSIEQREFFLRFNQNIVIYYMFPDLAEQRHEHKAEERIIIGYHGNKSHLEQCGPLAQALDDLAEKYSIEFLAMYNIEKLGTWKNNRPQKCQVRDVQWGPEKYHEYLAEADIGVIPAFDFRPTTLQKLLMSLAVHPFFPKWPRYYLTDYLLRFKYPTNAGRIYPFSQLHIPVVADFIPSNCQLIQDGYSGFLVYSREGWYAAIEQLIQSPELRQKMSKNLKEFIDTTCSLEENFRNFMEFLARIQHDKRN